MSNNTLLSIISHRCYNKNKAFWRMINNIKLENVDVVVTFQDENVYNSVCGNTEVNIEYIEGHCQGDNRLNASKRFGEYEYVILMDDDISSVSRCYQKEGKLGRTLPVRGLSKDEKYSRISKDFNDFITSGINKLNSGYACVMAQQKFFCEYYEDRYKDSKVTSCTGFAIWKSADLLKCVDNLNKYEYIKYHADDIFYEFYMSNNGMKFTCDTFTTINTTLGNSNKSVIRDTNYDKVLPIFDIVFLNKLFPNVLYRKMPAGYYKPVFKRGKQVGEEIYDRFNVLKVQPEFTKYAQLMEKL